MCGAVARLGGECIWRMETSGLQFQVMASYGVIGSNLHTIPSIDLGI